MSDLVLYNGAYSGPQVDAAVSRALSGGALDQAIAALRAAVGSPLVAATAAAMTDTSKIYVYTGSEAGMTAGNWYYWNGSAWTSGGAYNSAAADAAMSDSSTNAVQNRVIKAAIDAAEASAKEVAYGAFPTESSSGAEATTEIGADGIPLKSLVAQILPIWDGEGTPSTTNIRKITGHTGLDLTVNGSVRSISWQTEAGEVFVGNLDVLTGVLTVTHWGKSFAGTDIGGVSGSGSSAYYNPSSSYKVALSGSLAQKVPYSSHYRVGANPNDPTAPYITVATSGLAIYFAYVNSDGPGGTVDADVFKAYLDAQAALGTPVQLVWKLETPKTYQLDPLVVASVLGANSVSADTGDTAATFRCDPTLALEQIQNAILSLGNNT